MSTLQTTATASDWLAKTFRRPLTDLASMGDARFSGIVSPVYDAEEVKRYMSDYYGSLDGAESQDSKFNLNDYYRGLLAEAFERSGGVDAASVRGVLEVGCGFGSATLPLLEMLPNANVVASEFSVSMLYVLGRKLGDGPMRQRCALMQLNAEDMDFEPGSFDFVVGAAILHHLFKPEKVFESCARLLRPGGRAIFFEPFEGGLDIVSLIYEETLRNPRGLLLNPFTRRYMQNCISYWRNMRLPDKNDPFFSGADDKWLFTHDFVERHAAESGFSRTMMYGLEKSDRPFEALIKTHLKGNNVKSMPGWFWETVDRYERGFSDEVKRTLFTEGCIVLQK